MSDYMIWIKLVENTQSLNQSHSRKYDDVHDWRRNGNRKKTKLSDPYDHDCDAYDGTSYSAYDYDSHWVLEQFSNDRRK